MFGIEIGSGTFFSLLILGSLLVGALDAKGEEYNWGTFILCLFITPVLGLIYVIIKKIVKSVNRSKE